MDIQGLLYCRLRLWTNIISKPWSTGLDPLTYASDPLVLFCPKPKPKSGILLLRCFKTEGRWQVREWGSMRLRCTQKVDWKGIRVPQCPMLNVDGLLSCPGCPRKKESPPPKVEAEDDHTHSKGSDRPAEVLDSEQDSRAFSGEDRKPNGNVFLDWHLNSQVLHLWATFPSPSREFSVWVSSSKYLWNIQATQCLNNIQIAWSEKSADFSTTQSKINEAMPNQMRLWTCLDRLHVRRANISQSNWDRWDRSPKPTCYHTSFTQREVLRCSSRIHCPKGSSCPLLVMESHRHILVASQRLLPWGWAEEDLWERIVVR